MKNKKATLIRKVTGYSALAGSLVSLANVGNAQIAYTDISPDYTDSDNGASYSLDLNNDGTADFLITVATNGGDGVKLLGGALGNNAIAGTYYAPYKYVSALNAGEEIGAGLSWNEGGSQTMATEGYFQNPYGNWFGANDKYMGLLLNLGGDTHYAWARLDVSEDAHTFTIKDYALELTPDATIAAGAGGGDVGVEVTEVTSFNAWISERQLSVQLESNWQGGTLRVLNTAGQTILESKVTDRTTTFDLTHQAAGSYVVVYQQQGNTVSRKIVVN
jgi:hypothetical protein